MPEIRMLTAQQVLKVSILSITMGRFLLPVLVSKSLGTSTVLKGLRDFITVGIEVYDTI
jgi:hypothetical protein